MSGKIQKSQKFFSYFNRAITKVLDEAQFSNFSNYPFHHASEQQIKFIKKVSPSWASSSLGFRGHFPLGRVNVHVVLTCKMLSKTGNGFCSL